MCPIIVLPNFGKIYQVLPYVAIACGRRAILCRVMAVLGYVWP